MPSLNQRRSERIHIKEFLRIYCVDGRTMTPIELLDVSPEGCAFRIDPIASGPDFSKQSKMNLRFYFSKDTYLSLALDVKNVRQEIDEGIRYLICGCTLEQKNSSYSVYLKFIEFLKVYSENAERDVGDVTASYL